MKLDDTFAIRREMAYLTNIRDRRHECVSLSASWCRNRLIFKFTHVCLRGDFSIGRGKLRNLGEPSSPDEKITTRFDKQTISDFLRRVLIEIVLLKKKKKKKK